MCIFEGNRIRVRRSGWWLTSARVCDVVLEGDTVVEPGHLVCSVGAVKMNWEFEENV